MTEQTLNAAVVTSVENKALDAPIPLTDFADFQFQADAVRRLGGAIPE